MNKDKHYIVAWSEEIADGQLAHYVAVCSKEDGEPLGDLLVKQCSSAKVASISAMMMALTLNLDVDDGELIYDND